MSGRKRGKTAKGSGRLMPGNKSPLVLRALARKEAHLEEARNDINAFCEYVFEKPDGTPAKQGRIHREWQRFADEHKRLIVVAPRHHWKTGQAQGRLMFKLGRNINELLKIVCQSDRKATKRLTEIRTHMDSNDALHSVFPHLNIKRALESNKHMITLERSRKSPDPSIEALGVTSSASGDRATGIVADDVVDRRNAITLPKVRESIKASWDDWINLLGPEGWLMYICTLWHQGDLSHELMANPVYAVAWYEVNKDDFSSYVRHPDGTERRDKLPLWGSADGGPWTRKALSVRKAEMTDRQFARSFSNRPMSEGELAINSDWLKPWQAPPSKDWPRVIALDLASSQSAEADYTGVSIMAVCPHKPLVRVEDAFRLRLNFPDKASLVRYLYKHVPNVEFIVVELAAGGRELGEHLIKKYAMPIRGMKPQGTSKAARLDAATPFMENGQVEFNPALFDADERDRGNLISELTGFPVWDTDDILDSFTHGMRFVTHAFDVFIRDPEEDDEDWDEDDELYDDGDLDPSGDDEVLLL